MFFFKPDRYNPVLEEIENRKENRKPFFLRQRTWCTAFVVVYLLVWLVLRLLGFDVPLPVHFF